MGWLDALGNWIGGPFDGGDPNLGQPDADVQRRLLANGNLQGAPFDPLNTGGTQMQTQYNDAATQAKANREAFRSDEMMNRNAVSTAAPNFSTYSAPQVSVNQDRGDAGLRSANDAFTQQQRSGVMQDNQLNFLNQAQRGEGPSAAYDMAKAGAIQAQGTFQSAGERAARAFAQGANQANLGYGDAAAQQAYATQQAGQQAAQGFQDRNQAAMKSQASMAAGARGGDAGLAMRAGMMNAATSGQRANIESGRAQMAANQQAAYNAAGAQRAAFSNQAAGNLQAAGALEQANLQGATQAALAHQQGVQMRSQEQLAAMGMATDALNTRRGQDISAVGAAGQLAGLGYGADATRMGAQAQNADRTMAANQLNAGMDQYAAQNQLQRELANQNNAQGNMQMASGREMAYAGAAQGMAQQQAAAQQEYEKMRQQAFQHAQSLYGNYNTGLMNQQIAQQQTSAQQGGALIGAAGTLGAAALLSDKRSKKNIRKAGAPNLRKAASYFYQYKNKHQSDPRNGSRTHLGPMAQDLPRESTRQRGDGLIEVDTGRLAMLNVSATGDNQKRLDKLEKAIRAFSRGR